MTGSFEVLYNSSPKYDNSSPDSSEDEFLWYGKVRKRDRSRNDRRLGGK